MRYGIGVSFPRGYSLGKYPAVSLQIKTSESSQTSSNKANKSTEWCVAAPDWVFVLDFGGSLGSNGSHIR